MVPYGRFQASHAEYPRLSIVTNHWVFLDFVQIFRVQMLLLTLHVLRTLYLFRFTFSASKSRGLYRQLHRNPPSRTVSLIINHQFLEIAVMPSHYVFLTC